jgi:hypothetical protein
MADKLIPNWYNLEAKRKALTNEATTQGLAFKVKAYSDVGIETLDSGDYIATICTDTPDDEKEVLQPKMLDLRRFNKVQAVHFEHNLEGMPIGRCKWLKTNDHEMIAKYFVSQATPETRAIDQMIREGVLHMHSVSYLGKDAMAPTREDLMQHPNWSGMKVFKTKLVMIEFSVVGQPANSDCDMVAVGKSYHLTKESIDRLIGKTATSVKVAQEIVADIKATLTEGEMRKLICKRLEMAIGNINHDLVIKRAMKGLMKGLTR